MGFVSDWGRTSLSLRAASVGRRLWGSTGWGRRVSTKGASSTRVRITKWVIFLSCFVMLCSHFLWWFWLKFLICCCNFSGMALDHCDGWYWEKEYVEHIQKSLAKATDECTFVWWGSEPVEEWSIYFSWKWSRNPYSTEVHYRFSLFSYIWDCVHYIKALIN